MFAVDITDQVAKESSDSTASSHGMHQSDTGASSGGVATINDHKANPVSHQTIHLCLDSSSYASTHGLDLLTSYIGPSHVTGYR